MPQRALITTISLPSPPPQLPTTGAQRGPLSAQQQNVQWFYNHPHGRCEARWQKQPFFAPQHCKHPHHAQKHSSSTNFNRYYIGWLQAEDGIIIPSPPQFC
jgi:hypothetical protein